MLAVAVAGLTQLGAPFFVENLFNGAMLILAVGLAVYTQRRRERRNAAAEDAARRTAAGQAAEPARRSIATRRWNSRTRQSFPGEFHTRGVVRG